MKPKHLQFCLYYLQTKEPAVAYKMTYPKAGVKSLYAAASRLMARPDVSAWIRETENRMEDRLLREINDAQTAKKEQLLSINEKRAVLTRIITGDAKRVRHIKTKYGFTKVEDDQPIYAVLRAIDMDTRLERFFHLLAHPDNFKKSPSLYINTPTLQQQVNILISQSTGEIPKDKYQIPTEEIPKDKYQIPTEEELIISPPTESLSRSGGRLGVGSLPQNPQHVIATEYRDTGMAEAISQSDRPSLRETASSLAVTENGVAGSTAKEIPLLGGVGVGSLAQDPPIVTLSNSAIEPSVSNRVHLTNLNKIPLPPKLPRCIRHKKRKLHAQSRVDVAVNQHFGTKWAE